jgi:hypothetical protein
MSEHEIIVKLGGRGVYLAVKNYMENHADSLPFRAAVIEEVAKQVTRKYSDVEMKSQLSKALSGWSWDHLLKNAIHNAVQRQVEQATIAELNRLNIVDMIAIKVQAQLRGLK